MEKTITISEKEYNNLKSIAEKWNDLGNKIAEIYGEDNEEYDEEEGGDLADIGEVAASAFGYM